LNTSKDGDSTTPPGDLHEYQTGILLARTCVNKKTSEMNHEAGLGFSLLSFAASPGLVPSGWYLDT